MEYILKGYEPENLFRYFEEISSIPRGSGNEKGIADYLVAFAKARGLKYYRDEMHNVAIYRPASPGMEDKEPVMLQGHTDMVCEKNNDVQHDFTKDPLKLIEKNGFLKADGTTLGGDDGAAVVMMMAILEDKDLKAPAIECLFTVQEETGLGGAKHFDYTKLSACRIINLDSECEGVATASCAGSMNTTFVFSPKRLPFAGQSVKVSVSGLAGGHSGGDIHLGRKNAILLLADLLSALYDKEPFNLVSISGGSKRNAIPREAEAVIAVEDRDAAIDEIKKVAANIYPILVKEDKKLKIRASRCAKPTDMTSYRDTSKMLSFLSLLPNGVIGMSASVKGLVETSSNLGIARTGEQFTFDVYTRSSVESEADAVYIKLKRLAKETDAELLLLDREAGWTFNPDSKLQKDYLRVYSEMFPDAPAPRVEAIHAGLECGIILEGLGKGDAISIGPNMRDIHSPAETLDLRSVERTYRLLRALVQI